VVVRVATFAIKVGNVKDLIVKSVKYLDPLKMTLADALTWISVPFVLSTIYFGIRKGENNYYESDDYDGNGTAH
jgi:Na+/H+-dicarboxylate symporter